MGLFEQAAICLPNRCRKMNGSLLGALDQTTSFCQGELGSSEECWFEGKMAKSELDRDLSEKDYEQLAGMLSRIVGGKIPNLEALDGFLTALIISPELIKPSEFVPVIISGGTEEGDLVFESTIEAEQFYTLLMRYWNQINREFVSGEFHMPYLTEDEEGKIHGNDWAKSFLATTHLRFDVWAEIVNDEERSGPFVPIWALAYENSEDPSLRPFKAPITMEKRENLVASMIAGIKQLYDLFRGHLRTVDEIGPSARSPCEKVGRNDPCPCGSGKKFKKCCGQIAFH
jgi:uncharacterized protein